MGERERGMERIKFSRGVDSLINILLSRKSRSSRRR